MGRAWFSAGLLLAVGVTCSSDPVFVCADDAECRSRGAEGLCEVIGYCSFPADECPTGRRYGKTAGAGLAGLCVDGEMATTGASSTSISTSTGNSTAGTSGPDLTATSGSTASATTSSMGSTGGSTGDPPPVELCDGIDNDNDGLIDEASPLNVMCGTCQLFEMGASTYWFCAEAISWTQARSACAAYGASLSSINDAAEDTFIYDTAVAAFPARWWVGGNDRTNEGTWEWDDGSPFSYTNWGGGEPDDQMNQDCLMMRDDQNTWEDRGCGNARPYVCKAPLQ